MHSTFHQSGKSPGHENSQNFRHPEPAINRFRTRSLKNRRRNSVREIFRRYLQYHKPSRSSKRPVAADAILDWVVFVFQLLTISPSFWSFWFKMGRKWGAIGWSKNIITYSLSPFEQRAFAGFTKSLANFVRRVKWQLPYQLPAIITGVLIYNWGTNDFIRRNRKNPKDFENDEWLTQIWCGYPLLFKQYSGRFYLMLHNKTVSLTTIWLSHISWTH